MSIVGSVAQVAVCDDVLAFIDNLTEGTKPYPEVAIIREHVASIREAANAGWY